MHALALHLDGLLREAMGCIASSSGYLLVVSTLPSTLNYSVSLFPFATTTTTIAALFVVASILDFGPFVLRASTT